MSEINILPKPPEQLLAQVSVYADSLPYKEDPRRSSTLIMTAGHTALSSFDALPEVIEYEYTGVRFNRLRGVIETVNTGDMLPLFDKEEYIRELRRPNSKEKIANIAGWLQNYESFRDIINEADILNLPLEEAVDHPNFVANGGSEQVFYVVAPDAQGVDSKYAVRYAQLTTLEDQEANARKQTDLTNNRINTLSLGKGIRGLEQGVAVSFSPPVIVSEFVEGKHLYEMSLKERKHIPRKHIKQLKETVRQATDLGIDIDYNSDNFIYNSIDGFTIVDYRKPTIDINTAIERGKTSFKYLLQNIKRQHVITKN